MAFDIPAQIENLLENIRAYLAAENYRFSNHAIQRGEERFISYQDVLYVLENGIHEKGKTSFDSKRWTWKYAVRGKTTDNFDVRVIVSLERRMVIITVIRLLPAKKKAKNILKIKRGGK